MVFAKDIGIRRRIVGIESLYPLQAGAGRPEGAQGIVVEYCPIDPFAARIVRLPDAFFAGKERPTGMFNHGNPGNDRFVGIEPPVETVREAGFCPAGPLLVVHVLEDRADVALDICLQIGNVGPIRPDVVFSRHGRIPPSRQIPRFIDRFQGIDGGEGLRQAILEVGGVQLHHEAVAFQVRFTLDVLRLHANSLQRRQYDRHQQSDYADDNKKLDQGESSRRSGSTQIKTPDPYCHPGCITPGFAM